MSRSRRPWILAALAITGVALAGIWWTSRAPSGPHNVVIITLDTLRADRLGAYGYTSGKTPNLDGLSRAGVRFDDAVSSSPITGPAHAGLLTGRYPARFGVRDNATTALPESALTLAEMLAAAGYDTAGFIGAFILDRPYGFAQGFQTFDGFARVDSGKEANAERPAAEVVDRALQWLKGRTAGQPFFLWVHVYDAHAPYAPPAPFATGFAGQPYDGEIAYVDAQVGRVIEALEAKGIRDRTVVMALADHGESLGEHGEDEHGVFLYEPVIRIPWIAAGPGFAAGRIVTDQVRSLDLVPTVLGALGLRVPEALDGHNLMPRVHGNATDGSDATPAAYVESYYPRLHYGWSELRAVRADGWKVIDAPKPELYNLREDPHELRNVYSEDKALADRMIAEAVRFERDFTGGAAVSTAQPDRETMERLRSLGYVGTSAPTVQAGQRGPDPKDRINERREFKVLMSAAIDDLRAGRAPVAIDKFKRLIAINSQAYDLHQLLGEAYQTVGRLPEALGEYEYASILNAKVAAPMLAAAEVDLGMGNVASARRRRDQAAALDPESFDVSMVTGRILEAENRLPESLAAYERAVSQNSANPRPRLLLVGVASKLQRYDVADAQLRQLLAMNYQPSRTHFALGRIAQLRGQVDSAAQHYREALRLEPALRMAADALRAMGR